MVIIMKIGILFIPYGNTYSRYGKDKYLKIKQHGYDAVDYHIASTDSDLYTLSYMSLKEKLLLEKQAANVAGIEFSQIHGPWRCPPQDSTHESRQERMKKMEKAIMIAALLECKYMVIHPIMPYGVNDAETDYAQETWDLNIEFFSQLLICARKNNVTVCLENMPFRNFSLSKPEKILKLVETINDKHFKVCLDTGHTALFPELSLSETVHKLGDFIKTIHVHDNNGIEDSHIFPTRGIIDWSDFVKALAEIKFDGTFSLETTPSASFDNKTFDEESKKLCEIVKKLF